MTSQLRNDRLSLTRRALLKQQIASLVVLFPTLTASHAKAAEDKKFAGIDEGKGEEDVWSGAYVKPALSRREYLIMIRRARGPAFDSINRDIEMEDWRHLSDSLLLPPVDTLRQAVFFLPWLVTKEDGESSGIETQVAYLDFKYCLLDLDKVALDALRFEAEKKEVVQAAKALKVSLESFLKVASIAGAYEEAWESII
eukprot:CAMPEP_0196583958 /NCGR_PEP_ID=MMETSP1081-20130531/45320_1 /TAXON_ID=36882 /ORGANISM="Pyramimonas amylifera, Strain CCMP720" /LENGTH=197 /DNA_ID=CAMNT_0041905001 /DNA_START=260 /DNA_END=853 /DNA_ORIENTATION=+